MGEEEFDYNDTCPCGDLPAGDCMCEEVLEETDVEALSRDTAALQAYWNGPGLLKAFGGSN